MFRFVNSIISLLRWLLCSAKCEPLYGIIRIVFSILFFARLFSHLVRVYIPLFIHSSSHIFGFSKPFFHLHRKCAHDISMCWILSTTFIPYYVCSTIHCIYTTRTHIFYILFIYESIQNAKKKKERKKTE